MEPVTGTQTQLLTGSEGIETLVSDPEIDVVVAAIVGSAGLRGTWAALEAGKTVALANKESLVMAGSPGDGVGPAAGSYHSACR